MKTSEKVSILIIFALIFIYCASNNKALRYVNSKIIDTKSRTTHDEQQILILQKKNEALTHMVKVFDERSTAICNHFGIDIKEIIEHNNEN